MKNIEKFIPFIISFIIAKISEKFIWGEYALFIQFFLTFLSTLVFSYSSCYLLRHSTMYEKIKNKLFVKYLLVMVVSTVFGFIGAFLFVYIYFWIFFYNYKG